MRDINSDSSSDSQTSPKTKVFCGRLSGQEQPSLSLTSSETQTHWDKLTTVTPSSEHCVSLVDWRVRDVGGLPVGISGPVRVERV